MKNILTSLSIRMPLITSTRERMWIGLAWMVLVTGVLLRIMHYLSNRSLHLDEAMLARNILDRNPFDLLRPLDYDQGAPPLFLLLVDAATVLFGSTELALRLVPVVAALAGLFLFFWIAKIYVDKRYLPVQMCIFAFSYPLVYYSQEVKQYSMDVAVALALSYAFMRLVASDRARKAHLAVLGVGGGIAVWLSHPAVFVLAGIGISLLVLIGQGKSHLSPGSLACVFALWSLNFGIHYLFFLRTLTFNEDFLSYWQAEFLPAPTSIGAIKIYGLSLQRFLQFLGYPVSWITFIAALVAVSVGDAIQNKRPDSLSFVLPIGFTLVASVLHQYPFRSRLILFLAPFFYLLIVRGLQILTAQRGLLISLLLITLLLVPLSFSSARGLWTGPIFKEEVRPILHYLGEHQKPNDRVYIYYGAGHAVKYYQRYVRLPEHNVHWGKFSRLDRSQYLKDIEYMKQWPRVWFLFSHKWKDEEIFFRSNIDGKLLDQYHAPGASLYLYNFEDRGSN
jgi:Dolichyl-phosphate-mannose-protein mannosyltransferase